MNSEKPIAQTNQETESKDSSQTKIIFQITLSAVVLVLLWGFMSGRWERPMLWVFLGTWIIVGLVVPALAVPMDKEFLEGYPTYARRTRYRLIPGIW